MHDTHGRDGRDEIPGQSAARQQELSEEDTIAQLLIRAWGTRIGCDPPSENCSKQSRLPGLWMMKRVLASDCSLLVFFFETVYASWKGGDVVNLVVGNFWDRCS
jgi:hypothetical protein